MESFSRVSMRPILAVMRRADTLRSAVAVIRNTRTTDDPMGMSYVIDRERRLVRSRLWGAVSTTDIADIMSRVMVDPRFDPDFRSIADFRDATALTGDSMGFGAIASTQVYLPGTPRALVASKEDVVEMLRMFATYSERFGQLVRVFTDLAEAERWVAGAPPR
jgi:hypothetical protein